MDLERFLRQVKELYDENLVFNKKYEMLKYIDSNIPLTKLVSEHNDGFDIVLETGLSKDEFDSKYGVVSGKDTIGREARHSFVDSDGNFKYVINVVAGIDRVTHYLEHIIHFNEICDTNVNLIINEKENGFSNLVTQYVSRINDTLKDKKVDIVTFGGLSNIMNQCALESDGFIRDLESTNIFGSKERTDSVIRNLVDYDLVSKNIVFYESLIADISKKDMSLYELMEAFDEGINEAGVIFEKVNRAFFSESIIRDQAEKMLTSKEYVVNNLIQMSYQSLFLDKSQSVLDVFEKHIPGLSFVDDPYQFYAVFNRGDDVVLGFNWAVGEQAGKILGKVLDYHEVNTVLKYGNCGSLKSSMKLGDIYIPTSVTDSNMHTTTFENILSRENILDSYAGMDFKIGLGGIYNVKTPISETVSELKEAIEVGNFAVEMELGGIIDAVKLSSQNIDVGAIYYVSDMPLNGFSLESGKLSKSSDMYCVRELINAMKK